MARPLARFLAGLDAASKLAKTVLYNLNPRDNELFASMIGCFQDGTVPGKLQHGPAWWFLDQKDGIESQMRGLANMGLLSLFIGMTTDSRSFLSFSRHDYFRRILCTFVAPAGGEGSVARRPRAAATDAARHRLRERPRLLWLPAGDGGGRLQLLKHRPNRVP